MGLMNWLEKRARKQCGFNIRINTRTLVVVSNRADANLKRSGGRFNRRDAEKVSKAQESLRTDILLGLSNGLTLDEIRREHIEPAVDEEGGASDGARVAIDHVLRWVAAHDVR